jgi:hypothetical protein
MRTLAAFAGLVACLALLDTPPAIADPATPDATKVLWRDPDRLARELPRTPVARRGSRAHVD